MTTYVSVSEADDYLAQKLGTSRWLAAPPADKQVAVIQATNIINRLNFAGLKTVTYHAAQQGLSKAELRAIDTQQALAFPRNGDTDIPQDIKAACCECAFALINGIDPEQEMWGIATVSESVGPLGIRSTYDRTRTAEWTLAGVPSPTAWQLLLPYLRDPRSFSLCRV